MNNQKVVRTGSTKSVVVILGLIALLVIGAGAWYYFSPKPLEGSAMIDVGGHKLYVNVAGTGKPVVVFESGYADTSEAWAAVAPEVAKFATVCTYDRAGLGQSEPGNKPRTSEEIATQLHTLLHEANLPGPYILVGHSLGGIHTRIFNSKYPEEVAGIIFVDSSHDEQEERYIAQLPEEFKPMYLEQFSLESSYEEYLASAELAKNTRESMKNVPLIVLSADNHGLDELEPIWQEMQRELVALSTKGKQILAPNCDHNFHKNTNPGLVIEAVREMVGLVNGQ